MHKGCIPRPTHLTHLSLLPVCIWHSVLCGLCFFCDLLYMNSKHKQTQIANHCERQWANSTNCGKVNYMGLDKIGIMLWYHWQKKIIAPEKRTRRWEITPVLFSQQICFRHSVYFVCQPTTVLSCTSHKLTNQSVKTESNYHSFFYNGLLWTFFGSLSCTELSTLLPFSVWKVRPKPDKILTAHALLPHWMWTGIRQNWQQILLKQFSFHFIDNVHSSSCLVWDLHSLVNPVASFFECLFP